MLKKEHGGQNHLSLSSCLEVLQSQTSNVEHERVSNRQKIPGQQQLKYNDV